MSEYRRRNANSGKYSRHAGGRRNIKPKKRRSAFSRILIIFFTLVILCAVVVGGLFIFAPDFVRDKVDDIQRLQYPQKYTEYVEKYSELYDVDENLVYGVIHTESHFDPDSSSGAGAMGLMQITSDCFDFLKSNIPDDDTNYDVQALYNPETNIKFGTYFLSYLLNRYDNIEKTALAAYNAGFGTVDKWLSDSSCSADGKNLDVILYPETDSYVKKVENAKNKYKDLY